MLSPRTLLGSFLCCAVGLAVSSTLGVTYSSRHSSHAGFFQVPVHDALGPIEGFHRPRRTVVVVFDGLPYDDAVTMRSFARIAEEGQCLRTHVGELSISRPVYAAMSTGLEQDRTGARGNDDTSPLAAESVWEIARRTGLHVSAVSELPWWRELFPRGFDDYVMPERAEDYFTHLPAADLQLVHPIYVDETAHAHGAECSAYRDCVSRADHELGELLDTVDLSQDLVIATADHGHTLRGGHGGPQDRVSHVLACYAGPGVQHRADEGVMRATSIGPSLSLLLGLPFPAQMRAGEDDLDALWRIADPAAFPAGYLDERRQTVERFRIENEAQLRRWLPSSDGSWARFRAHHRALQYLRALPCALLIALLLAGQAWLHFRIAGTREEGRAGARRGAALVGLFFFGIYALQIALRGSFDLSSVSEGDEFIAFTAVMTLGTSLLAIGLRAFFRRDLGAFVLDWTVLSLVGTLLSLAHPIALGWHVGYPAPSADVYFFPYFAALALGVAHTIGMIACVTAGIRARRARRAARAR